MVKKITNNNMDEILASPVALVDFSATWCGPCQMLAPVLEEIAEEMDGQLGFYNIDSDENMMLAAKYQVTSIPTLLLLKNGEVAAKTVGFLPKANLKDFITQNL